MKIKYILISIIIFGLGFIFGQYKNNHQKLLIGQELALIQNETIQCQTNLKKAESTLNSLKLKLGPLADVDLKEYNALIDEKEKYKKADELLGKIFLIFLADLGLHAEVRSAHTNAVTKNPDSSTILPNGKVMPAALSIGERSRPSFSASEAKVEVKFPKTSERSENGENLDRLRLEKPFETFRLTDYAQKFTNSLKAIQGHFEGVIEMIDHTPHLNLILDVNFQKNNKILEGSFLSQIIRNDKIISKSQGNGSNRSLKTITDKDNELLIELGGDDRFAHLIYLRDQDMFVGNYYNKDKIVGKIKLYRQ